jgi:phage recombination protein Bet
MTILPAETASENVIDWNLVQRMYAKNCSPDEFAIFCTLAKRYGLDPTLKQIWAIKYPGAPAMVLVGRDGLLDIAHRSGHFDGMESGTEGSVETGLIGWAKVYRNDMTHPFAVTVDYEEYVGKTKSGQITRFWLKMPKTMIAKVAEAQCLKKAFRISGLYSEDEMPTGPREIPDTSVQSINCCSICGEPVNPENIKKILSMTDNQPMCDPCASDWYKAKCEKEDAEKHAIRPAEVIPVKPEVKPEPVITPDTYKEEEKPVNICQRCGVDIPINYTHCQKCYDVILKERAKKVESKTPGSSASYGRCVDCGCDINKNEFTISQIVYPVGTILCAKCHDKRTKRI